MFAYSCCILIPKSSSTGTYICIPGLKYLLIRLRSGTKLQHLVFRGSKSLPGPTRQRTHAQASRQAGRANVCEFLARQFISRAQYFRFQLHESLSLLNATSLAITLNLSPAERICCCTSSGNFRTQPPPPAARVMGKFA